jgi:hypothetical protein
MYPCLKECFETVGVRIGSTGVHACLLNTHRMRRWDSLLVAHAAELASSSLRPRLTFWGFRGYQYYLDVSFTWMSGTRRRVEGLQTASPTFPGCVYGLPRF